MKIIIGHLFYDLLNLYGESGNILALKNALLSQDIEVEIKNLSLDNDCWMLDDIDFLYIGAGTEQNQTLALNTLMKYKENINQMVINNKFILATGNSIELFGKVINKNDKEISALSIFDYTTQRTLKRMVSECIFNHDDLDSKILGFENHQGEILGISNPLFTVEKGIGSNNNVKTEGFKHNNFYATYLLGPILARNPEFLEKICKDLILNKDSSFEFRPFNFDIEKKAHDKFLTKYTKD